MAKAPRKEVTKWLGKMLMRDIFKVPSDPRHYWASEVTLRRKDREPGESEDIRVDFMQFVPVNQTAGGIDRGEFICYEVKSCKAEFKSKHGHNLIGDKNYYVMTEQLLDELKAEDPHLKQLCLRHGYGARAGVYVPRGGYAVGDEDFKETCEEAFPQLALYNPLTKTRETGELSCVLRADVNAHRPYSNSELLFAMLRSAGRDRKQYDRSWWT